MKKFNILIIFTIILFPAKTLAATRRGPEIAREAEEAQRAAEQQRQAAEAERIEAQRAAEQQRQAAEAQRVAEQQRQAAEAQMAEAKRIEAERAQAQRAAEQQRQAAEAQRAEAKRIEAERIEAERIEAERIEAERIEAERIEAERIEAERIEAERIEAERIEAKRIEAKRIEAERAQAERAQAQRVAEQQRQAAEAQRAEAERIEAKRIEAERAQAERAQAQRVAEQQRQAAEAQRAEAERIEAERIEAERAQAQRVAEQQRQAAEAKRIEAKRIEAERAEAQRVAEQQRQAAEAQRIEAQRAAEQRLGGKREKKKEVSKKWHATRLEFVGKIDKYNENLQSNHQDLILMLEEENNDDVKEKINDIFSLKKEFKITYDEFNLFVINAINENAYIFDMIDEFKKPKRRIDSSINEITQEESDRMNKLSRTINISNNNNSCNEIKEFFDKLVKTNAKEWMKKIKLAEVGDLVEIHRGTKNAFPALMTSPNSHLQLSQEESPKICLLHNLLNCKIVKTSQGIFICYQEDQGDPPKNFDDLDFFIDKALNSRLKNNATLNPCLDDIKKITNKISTSVNLRKLATIQNELTTYMNKKKNSFYTSFAKECEAIYEIKYFNNDWEELAEFKRNMRDKVIKTNGIGELKKLINTNNSDEFKIKINEIVESQKQTILSIQDLVLLKRDLKAIISTVANLTPKRTVLIIEAFIKSNHTLSKEYQDVENRCQGLLAALGESSAMGNESAEKLLILPESFAHLNCIDGQLERILHQWASQYEDGIFNKLVVNINDNAIHDLFTTENKSLFFKYYEQCNIPLTSEFFENRSREQLKQEVFNFYVEELSDIGMDDQLTKVGDDVGFKLVKSMKNKEKLYQYIAELFNNYKEEIEESWKKFRESREKQLDKVAESEAEYKKVQAVAEERYKRIQAQVKDQGDRLKK